MKNMQAATAALTRTRRICHSWGPGHQTYQTKPSANANKCAAEKVLGQDDRPFANIQIAKSQTYSH